MRIKDIAREAGVSTATVSHVINKTKFVSEATRRRVELAVEKFQYHPNAHAQMLALGRSKIIGLLVSDITNPFFPEIVKGIEGSVINAGYNLFLLNTNYDTRRTLEYVHRLIQMKVAGIILMTGEFDEALIEEAKKAETSFVFRDLGFVGPGVSNVILEYAMGIEEAVKHLVDLGHRDIVHIAGPTEVQSAGVRSRAFVDSIRKHLPDAPEPRVFVSDFRSEGGRAAAREILAEKVRPTAVVVANDLMALGAMQEFKSAGLSVPKDISIVGFDDIEFASLSEPALTTVNSPRLEIGRRAVEALMQTIGKRDVHGSEIRIGTSLVVRGSTARPGR